MSRPKGRAERGTIVEDEPNLKIIMANTKREKLFAEFPPVPTEKWEEVIAVDLKGADYSKVSNSSPPNRANFPMCAVRGATMCGACTRA